MTRRRRLFLERRSWWIAAARVVGVALLACAVLLALLSLVYGTLSYLGP